MHIHIFSATTRRQIHAYVFSALARHVTLPAPSLNLRVLCEMLSGQRLCMQLAPWLLMKHTYQLQKDLDVMIGHIFTYP